MEAIISKKFKRFRNQKGLTLIELLAVVVVLGIIAAIAVPSVTGVINRAKIQADLGTYNIIKDAGLRYALAENVESTTTVSVSDLVDKGYLNAAPEKKSDKVAAFDNIKITVSSGKYTVQVYANSDQSTEITESTFN